MIDDGELAGNNGPPLLAMKQGFRIESAFSTNMGSNRARPIFLYATLWKTWGSY